MELYYISHPYTSNGDTRDNIKQSREIKKTPVQAEEIAEAMIKVAREMQGFENENL